MIKRVMIVLLFLCFIYSLKVQAQPVPSGRRLREIVAGEFGDSVLIGATTGVWAYGTLTGMILGREFNYVTPENDFKQWSIHPDNADYYNWFNTDRWIPMMSDHNIEILRMHGPIGPQCSGWAQDDSRTPEELDTNMCDFMVAVCQRYNGTPKFDYMDVVNETVVGGSWHTDKPGTGWECPWYKMGLDTAGVPIYIIKAFEIADTCAPDIKLIYNHHEEPYNTASWNLIKQTVLYLRDLGLRVDGIGWQAHVDYGYETPGRLNSIRALIDWAHANNLEFHVTEASVWVKDGPTQEHFDAQAATYRAILDVLLEKRFTGKVGWNTWHIEDLHGWHAGDDPPNWYPSLFDTVYAAKPAYYAIQAALEGEDGIEDPYEDKTVAFKLYNNPNPFASTTSIWFEIPVRSYVNLSVYNLAGQEVANLVSEDRDPGRHTVDWNAEGLSAGIYFCLMKAEDFVLRHEMILVR